MLNNQQIKLIQIAVKEAGIRKPKDDRRYRLLLAQYKRPDGSAATSCKHLNHWQLEDMLAICEAHGFRCRGKDEDHFRQLIKNRDNHASYAQRSAIEKLGGDLGWDICHVNGLIDKMTNGACCTITELTPHHAFKVIEALKAMFSRKTGKEYKNLQQIKEEMEAPTDGQKQDCTGI